jgi:hypothetical protein
MFKSENVDRVARMMSLFCALLLTCMPVFGQESTGNIAGTVTDPSGAVVPDVSVTITNLANHRVYTTRTVGDGTYRMQDLAPGRYSVVFEKSGFSRYDVTDSSVLVGKTLRLDAAMELGSTTQTITVTEAPPLIDTGSTMVAHNVPVEELALLPKGRGFQGVALFSTSVNTGEIEGGYQINGASAAENNYYIDGVSTTSLIDGSARQTAAFEHLAEVQVKTAGLEAEYGGALGGVVTAVTKSGGNNFHGDVHYYYYGNGISAAPPERMQIEPTNRAEFSYFQDRKNQRDFHEVGGSLGGPFIKDKLYFFSSISPRWNRSDYKYEFIDGPGSMKREAYAMSWFNKLSFDPWTRVRTNFSWLYTPQRSTGSLYAYDGYGPNESVQELASAQGVASRGYSQPEQSYSGSVDLTLSTRSLLSVKGGRYYLNYKEIGIPYQKNYWWQNSSIGIPGVPADLQFDSGYRTPDSAATKHDLTTRSYVQADFSQFLNLGGQHNIKAGVGTQKNVNNVYDDWFGTNGRIELFWGLPYCRTFPDGSQQCDQGTYGYYAVNQGGTIGTAGASITHMYVQDSWRIHSRLTVNLGLRTEKETIPSFQRDVQDYAIKFGFGDKLAPRFGASYDVFGNGKLKVSGAWGRFFDWTKFDLARGTFGADIWRVYYRSLDTTDVFNIDLTNMPGRDLRLELFGAPFRNRRVPGFQYLDPNVKPMSSDIFNLGVEYEVKPQMVFSGRYVRNKLNRTIEDMGALDAAGDEVYRYGNPGEGANTVEPASGATCVVQVAGACGVPMPKAKRIYDAMELQLLRRFSNGWMASASYVYSRLWGNYSGLQSTDEIRPGTLGYGFGTNQVFAATDYRPGGNANRYFDLDEALYDAHGHNGLYGPLPTERPHVFKFYGAYEFKFGTQIGTFFRASSGTPVTTQVQTVNQIPFYVEGRGDFGRTPTWNQTDLMVAHEIKFGDVKKLRFEFNMINLFNQKTSLFTFDRYNQEELSESTGIDLSAVDLSKGFDWKALVQENVAATGIPIDPRFGKAAVFNTGFEGRFLIKFIF